MTVDDTQIDSWAAQFHREGYLVLHDVLDPDLIAQLKVDLDRGLEEEPPTPNGIIELRHRMFEFSDANLSLFDREPTASRFGRQTGGTHGGLLFSRSPNRLAHSAPGMLRDVDMQGCYNRVTAGIDVYLGRPVIFEPGDEVVTLADAVAFATGVAPPDGWLVRVSGRLSDGVLNVLVPSTEGANVSVVSDLRVSVLDRGALFRPA